MQWLVWWVMSWWFVHVFMWCMEGLDDATALADVAASAAVVASEASSRTTLELVFMVVLL